MYMHGSIGWLLLIQDLEVSVSVCVCVCVCERERERVSERERKNWWISVSIMNECIYCYGSISIYDR